MGKYYQTAIPEFVQDKMFQLPAELMFQVIQQTDKNIDEEQAKIDAFNGKLDIQNINTDDPAVNARLKELKDSIYSVSDKINKSPLDYKKYRGDISRLSRELDNDLQRGLLGKAQQMKTLLDEEMDRIEKMADVSNERKALIKKAVENKYRQAGGLAYQDPNTYNDISTMFINPLEEFDEEKFINTIGMNFEGDATSSAWSNPDNVGYIRSGSKTITIRNEADIENYVKDSLSEGTWEAQKRQLYELKRDAGIAELTDEQIDTLVEQDKQSLINRAKNKLGFKKEQRSANTTSDGTYNTKWSAAQRKIEAGEGVILEEVRDPRNAIGGEFSSANLAAIKTMDNKVKVELGYDDYKTLYNDVFTGANKEQKIREFRQKLTDKGIPYSQFVDYMNYQYGIERLETPHPDGYDPTNPDDITRQQTMLNGLITALNNRNPNEEVKRIRISTADGQYYETKYNSVGALIEDRNANYVYIPATGSTKNDLKFKKDPKGNFIDDEGAVVVYPNNHKKEGQPVKSYEEAVNAGVVANLTVDTTEMPTYDSSNVIFKADKGNTKQVNQKRFDVLNREKNEKEYVVTNPYYRINPANGKYEMVNVDVYIDSNKIGVKQ